MPKGVSHRLAKTVDVFRLRDGVLSQIDPDGRRHVAIISVKLRWFYTLVLLVEVLYRPYYGVPTTIGYALALLLLAVSNGYMHYRLRSSRTTTWRWILAICVVDVFIVSTAVVIGDGFSHYFLHLFYYPALAGFAVVFSSFKLNMAWVTMVSIVYVGISLGTGDGLDIVARDEKALFARIAVMYGLVAGVNMISSFERVRWREAVERERALLRERTEMSQKIHNTMAQSAYMIGVGIDRVKELADKSNKDLMSALEQTSNLSRYSMWELRHPIEIGDIFDGLELGDVLESLVATFSSVSSVNAEFERSGDEPPLPTSTRGALFSIAHNALANALRHSNADHVRVCLDFEDTTLRMSISDNGDGLPIDYETRGKGFKNMRKDAERVGGKLMVESSVADGGTTVTCIAPYKPTGGS